VLHLLLTLGGCCWLPDRGWNPLRDWNGRFLFLTLCCCHLRIKTKTGHVGDLLIHDDLISPPEHIKLFKLVLYLLLSYGGRQPPKISWQQIRAGKSQP